MEGTFAWKIEQNSTNFMCFFFQGHINLQHIYLLQSNMMIIYRQSYDIIHISSTYVLSTCKISPIQKKNKKIANRLTPGILGSCHDAFPSLWRMVFNSGLGELLECGCLRTAWWWELGLLLRMVGMVGQLMGWWWVGDGLVDGWWLVKLWPQRGCETFWWDFFWVGVQMSFWDGGEVVGVWLFWEKKRSKASLVGY